MIDRLTFSSDEKNGELAPRSWVLESIDGQSLQAHWNHLYRIFLEDEDPQAKGFWHLYQSNTSNILIPIQVPDARVNPLDEGFKAYNKDKGSQAKAQAHILKIQRHHDRSYRVRQAERDGKNQVDPIAPPPNPLRPRINMFIRPANENDVPQLTKIYNYYAEHTVLAPENEGIAQRTMAARLRSMEEARLPFLVAVAKASNPNRKARDDSPFLNHDAIIGFAAAEEMGPQNNMWGFTVDIEVYIDNRYYSKGAGKNLLDRLLFCLDPNYQVTAGCEWYGGEEWEYGSRRRVANILCHVPYASQDLARIAWVGGLLERFQFEKCGDMKDIGIKFGQL